MRITLTAALMVLGLAAAPALAQQQPVLTITGNGSVVAEPDLATVTSGVETTAPTAAEALGENSRIMSDVFRVLTGAGIAKTDIMTNQLSVRPEYRETKSSLSPRETEIYQYRVNNAVSVTVRDLDKLGSVLDQIVRTGVNQINGIGFGHSKPAPLLDQARRIAVENAISTAELYAGAAGVRLGTILSISEYNQPGSGGMASAFAVRAGAPVPTSGGQTSINSSVTIVWQIVED